MRGGWRATPRFGLHVSGAVFGGWVKQSSPACAAASVAGAWNALAGGGRRGPLALRQDDVLRHMRDILVETIASKRARFERLLGAPIADFEEALDRAFEDAGKTLGGESKAVPGLKRVEAMRLAIALAKSRGEPELDAEAARATNDCRDVVDEKNTPPRTSFAAIAALVREDEADKGDEAENEGSEAEEPEEEEEDDDDRGGDERGREDASGKENDAGKKAERNMNDDDDATLLAALAAGVDITGGAVKKNVAASPPRDSSRGSEASPPPPPPPSPPTPTPPSPPLDVVGDGVKISGRYSRNARGWRSSSAPGRARRRLVTAASRRRRGDAPPPPPRFRPRRLASTRASSRGSRPRRARTC